LLLHKEIIFSERSSHSITWLPRRLWRHWKRDRFTKTDIIKP